MFSSYRLLRSGGLYFGANMLFKKSIWARQPSTGLGSIENTEISSSLIEAADFEFLEGAM